MERASRAFQKHKLTKPLLTDEEVLRASWRAAVGRIIAKHTSRVRLVRTTLLVEVEDAIWQRQLNSLRRQILDQVRKTSGNMTLTEVEFRIAVPRRQAQRALSAGVEGVFAGAMPATSFKSPPPSGSNELRRPAPAAPTAQAPAGRTEQKTLWSGGPEADDSDAIQDPVLKKVYQLSRRKASA
jgi:hypothetical protein